MTDCLSQRIVFAGTPEFAQVALDHLIHSNHDVVAVLTQPDRPAGRGRSLVQSPVKQLAIKHTIPLLQPNTLKEQSSIDAIADLRADVMVVAAYGLILPESVLRLPTFGCLNIHASLLPRWRGAAPIHRAIAEGDSETGVCIMQMDTGLDTGDVLHRVSIPIGPMTTTGELHDELAALGAKALMNVLPKRCDGTSSAEPQPTSGVTYANKIEKSEAVLDFSSSSAVQLHRKICAFNPWPVAETTAAEERLRLWRSELGDGTVTDQQPGTVIKVDKQGLHVATAQGVLILTQLQRSGKKAMSAWEVSQSMDFEGLVLGCDNKATNV